MTSVTEKNMKNNTSDEPALRDVMDSLISIGSRLAVLEKFVTSGFSRVNDQMDTNLRHVSVVNTACHKVLLQLDDIQDDLTCALGEVDSLSRKSLVQGQRISLLATQREAGVI